MKDSYAKHIPADHRALIEDEEVSETECGAIRVEYGTGYVEYYYEGEMIRYNGIYEPSTYYHCPEDGGRMVRYGSLEAAVEALS